MPPFLKVDLSGAVVLIGAFIFGIAPAITMIGIKDIIHLTQTQTGGSGEVADFLMLSTLVVIAVLLYRGHKSRKMAVLGCAAGSVAMACVGMLTNYFLIIPFYSQVMPLQAIFDACNAINPYVTGMQGLSAAWRSAVQSHQRRNSDCDYHARLQETERVHQVQADRTAPLQTACRISKKRRCSPSNGEHFFCSIIGNSAVASMISTKICIRIDKMRGQDYITCVHLIDSVQSRFMRKIICRLRLSEVSRQ